MRIDINCDLTHDLWECFCGFRISFHSVERTLNETHIHKSICNICNRQLYIPIFIFPCTLYIYNNTRPYSLICRSAKVNNLVLVNTEYGMVYIHVDIIASIVESRTLEVNGWFEKFGQPVTRPEPAELGCFFSSGSGRADYSNFSTRGCCKHCETLWLHFHISSIQNPSL